MKIITATFLAPQAPPPPKPKPENPGGFLGGLAAGWHALLASLKVVLTVVGALLPWALVIGPALWLAFYLYRRYGRGRLTPALAPAGTPPLAATPSTPERPTHEPQNSENP